MRNTWPSERWLIVGWMGVLVGITMSCSGESQLSPSVIRENGLPLESPSVIGSSQVVGRTAGTEQNGASTVGGALGERAGGSDKRRARKKVRRRDYCESLPEGHEDYERCQAWLKSGRGKDSGGPRRSAQRRRKYCKDLPKGHEHYKRCQKWLKSEGRGPN